MDYKTYVLNALQKCAEENLRQPGCNLKKGCFDNRSYTKWATYEVLYAIECYEGEPEDAIELFMSKMNRYACLNQKSGIIFSIAYDVAVWMLDLLIGLEK